MSGWTPTAGLQNAACAFLPEGKKNNRFVSHHRKTLPFLPSESSQDGNRSDEKLGGWTQTLTQLKNLS